MSDPHYWRDRLDFVRREESGFDAATRNKLFDSIQVLVDEPCDLSMQSRRTVQQTPAGTVYNTIKEPVCKVWPESELSVPDEDDLIVVNGERFRVTTVERFYDGATGDFRGARLVLRTADKV